MDALGLPIRTVITPGQRADSPQAHGLIEGLKGVGHVIMNAAYDADRLRTFIAKDLAATAHIERNPKPSGCSKIAAMTRTGSETR